MIRGKFFIIFSIIAFLLVSPSVAGVTDNIYLGDEALKSGDYDTAIVYYQAAIKAYPEYTLPYVLIANTYYLKGDYDSALKNAKHALLINSEDRGALLAKAQASGCLGKYESSLICFESLLKKNENNPQLILGKTRVLLNLYGPEEALQYIIGTSENGVYLQTAEYYDLLGDLYSGLEELDLAKSNYQKALEFDPDFSNTLEKYNNLVSQEQISAQQSIEKSAAGLEWYEWGKTQVKKKQYNDALDSFNMAYSMDSSLFDSIVPYATYIYIKQNDYSNATKFSQYMVLQDDSNAEAWNFLGVAYENTGKLNEAKVAYEKAISLDSSDTNARLNLLWMELKNILFNPIFAVLALISFILIFVLCWIYALKRKTEFPVFGVLGIIFGIIIGIIITYYSDHHPMMGFMSTVIGCSTLGLFCGHLYSEKFGNYSEIIDLPVIKWTPYLTYTMIIGGIFAGLINTYCAITPLFNTINGILLGIIIVFFSFDFFISHKCGLELINFKNKYEPISNSILFYIFIISIYFWLYTYSNDIILPDDSLLSPIFRLFAFFCFIGLFFPIFMVLNFKYSIFRMIKIIMIYVLCIIPGIALYIIFDLLNPYEMTVSEKPIFVIIIGAVIFYFIFSRFDNKKSQKLNKIRLSLGEEEKKKERILEKISNATGNNNDLIHGDNK